jgi:YggT family protein
MAMPIIAFCNPLRGSSGVSGSVMSAGSLGNCLVYFCSPALPNGNRPNWQSRRERLAQARGITLSEGNNRKKSERCPMAAILDLIMVVLRIATFIIIIQAVLSWLVGFNVLSIQNPTVRSIWGGLQRITEPVYRPIRNILPPMGGLDLTPMVVLLIIFFLERVIARYGYGVVPF